MNHSARPPAGRRVRPLAPADRYRDLIIQTAEHVLRTALDGNVSWADCNKSLQAARPDWFGQPGSARTPRTSTSVARAATSKIS